MNSLSIHTLAVNRKMAISAFTAAAKALFWSLFLWLAGIFVLAPVGAQAPALTSVSWPTLADVNCGAFNQRVCTPSDAEYWVADARGQQRVCDYGLTPLTTPGSSQLICGNLNRNTLGNIFNFSANQDPRGFVMHEQEQAIGADVPINMVNTLGTHNSYSNYQEGYIEDYSSMKFNLELDQFAAVFDPWAADQYYSISDQLNAGARYIRIDPYFYDNQLRVCHGPEFCQFVGDGRLFIYIIREIADWLNAHPGEFITIFLNDYDVKDAGQQALEIGIIDEYLSGVLYKPSEGLPGYLTENGPSVFPTLRQMRTLGKQAIIFSANDFLKTNRSQNIWPHKGYSPNDQGYWPDGYDTNANVIQDYVGLNLAPTGCMGGTSQGLLLTQWSNAGEDRSGSMTSVMKTSSFPYFVAGNADGLMDTLQTTTAARCGVSVIDLDFWGALNHAFHFGVTVDGLSINLVDFRGPANDTRPLAASWSYISNDSNKGPASLIESLQQWVSQPDNTNLPYACAALRENPAYVGSGLYEWATTSTAGPWSGGEAACQQLGSQYHFWFPQSTYEQNSLLRYAQSHQGNLNGAIWLNYRSATYGKQLVTAPSQISVVTAIGNTPPSQTIWVGGGNGDKLEVRASGPFQAKQVMSGSWPTNQIELDPIQGAFNQIGTRTENVMIEEVDPATGATQNVADVPIRIKVTDAIESDLSDVQLAPGTIETIHLSGSQGTSDHIPFQVGKTPDWLVAKVSATTTPATITFSAMPMPKGIYLLSLPLIQPGSNSTDMSTSITIQYTVQ